MQNTMPCVGLVVLLGSLSFVIAPDETPADLQQAFASGGNRLPIVVLDPGHGGRDEGARANGLVEKDLTLDLAGRIDQRLKTFGFRTVWTRENDSYVGLPDRAAVGNRYDDALFVSLHFNHTANSAASGVETFYESDKVPPEPAWTWIGFFNKPDPMTFESGEGLAASVQTALVMRTDAPNRGIKARDFFVVRHVRSPAVLVEGGFISNPFEARLISNPQYRDRLATAIVEGVMGYVKSRPAAKDETGPLVKLEQ